MEFAFWSLAYLLPLLAYVWSAIVHGRSLLDPLAIGGGFLFAMFFLTNPFHQTASTPYLLLLHTACAGAYWLGGGLGYRLAGIRRAAPVRRGRLEARGSLWLICMLSALLIAVFIFATSYESSVNILLEMRNRTNLRLGAIDMRIGMLERVALYLRGYVAPLATLGLLFWCRRARPTLMSGLLVAATLGMWALVAVGGGSRGAVLFMLVECAFAVSYASERSERRWLAPRLLIALLLPLGAGTVLAQTLYRSTGLPTGDVVTDLRPRAGEAVMTMVDHLSFNDEVAFVLANYPNIYGYTRGHSLYASAVFIVPRAWWPAKPVPWGRTLAWQNGFRYQTTVSLAATVPGEGYANFGLAGWVSFPLVFGLVIGWTFRRLRNGSDDFDLVFGLWGLFWALCMRGDIHSAVVSIILPYFVVALGLRLFGFRRVQVSDSARMLHSVLSCLGGGEQPRVAEAGMRRA